MIIMHICKDCHYQGIMIQVLLHCWFFCFISMFVTWCASGTQESSLFIELALIVRTVVLCDCLNIWFSISLQNIWVIF